MKCLIGIDARCKPEDSGRLVHAVILYFFRVEITIKGYTNCLNIKYNVHKISIKVYNNFHLW
jgi:hypothetical protein